MRASDDAWEAESVTGKTPYVVIVDFHNGAQTEVGARTQAVAIARAKYRIVAGGHKVKSVVITGPQGWVPRWGPGHSHPYRDEYNRKR